MPPVSAECSDHPTLSLVVRIKHLNATSQCSRIFNCSTGSAREGDITIAMSWFSCTLLSLLLLLKCFVYTGTETDYVYTCTVNWFSVHVDSGLLRAKADHVSWLILIKEQCAPVNRRHPELLSKINVVDQLLKNHLSMHTCLHWATLFVSRSYKQSIFTRGYLRSLMADSCLWSSSSTQQEKVQYPQLKFGQGSPIS